jgi:hypothetical protein
MLKNSVSHDQLDSAAGTIKVIQNQFHLHHLHADGFADFWFERVEVMTSFYEWF